MTAQEDNAVLEVLVRAHKAGFADYGRAILYRSGSDFDRAPDLANDYMNIEFNNNSTDLVDPSVANLFTVGNPIVQAVCFTTHTDCGQLDPRMGAGRCTAEQHVVRGCLWHPPLVDSYTHSHRYPPLPPPNTSGGTSIWLSTRWPVRTVRPLYHLRSVCVPPTILPPVLQAVFLASSPCRHRSMTCTAPRCKMPRH